MAKTSRSVEDTRLTKICLALPESTRRDSSNHAALAVRKKTFAYVLYDHHGDGIVSVGLEGVGRRERRPRSRSTQAVLLAGLHPARNLSSTDPGELRTSHQLIRALCTFQLQM